MSFKEFRTLVKSDIDLKRHWFLKNDSSFNKNIRVYLEPGTIAVITYRFGHLVRQIKVPVLKQLLRLIYILMKTFVVLDFGTYIPSA